jgi:hypothetical protein
MTTVVLDSKDLVESVTTGTVPVPAGIAEDNARQAEKRGEKPAEAKPAAKADEADPVKEAEAALANADDVEGEDGLTPRQRREYTAAMLKTIGKKHRAQKEAEELATRQYNDRVLAEQRAQEAERQLAEIKAKTAPAPKVEEAKVPAREDFKDDQSYWDAMVDYRVDQRLRVAQAEAAQRRDEEHQAAIVAKATERVEKARELVPDFNEVVGAIDAPIPPYVANYMQESEMLGELSYYFGQHPEALTKLAKITEGVREGTRAYTEAVTKQLVALGKIESTLQPFASKAKVDTGEPLTKNGKEPSPETGTAPSKPRVQAPIIAPLNGGSASQVLKDEADMTGSQVITAWQKKHGVTLTARKRH